MSDAQILIALAIAIAMIVVVWDQFDALKLPDDHDDDTPIY